jgi:hypothetical protein
MPPDQLTGLRASTLRAAWWGVLLASLWLVAAWPIEAYRVVFGCDPDHVRHADAGNGFSLALGALGILMAALALVRRDLQTYGAAAAMLLLGLFVGLFEWMFMTMAITHRCGVTLDASWFARPTRDAALGLTFSGPALLVLTRVLRWLERRAAARESLPRAEAVTDRARPSS